MIFFPPLSSWTSRLAVLFNLCFRLAAYLFLRWIPSNDIAPYAYASFVSWLVLFFQNHATLLLPTLLWNRNFVQSSPPESEPAVHGKTTSTLDQTKQSNKKDTIEVSSRGTKVPISRFDAELTRPWSLVLGLPKSSSRFWTAIVFGSNLVLLCMMLDRIYTPYYFHKSDDVAFARVGYVSSTTADILIRDARPIVAPKYVEHRAVPSNQHATLPTFLTADRKWQQTPITKVFAEFSDFTATVRLKDLRPDTRYEFNVSGHASGFLSTAPATGAYPHGKNKTFTFLHTSCIKSRIPYALPPPFTHPLSIHGLRHLTDWIPKLQAQFMLFLGDFIYIDVPKRFSSDKESYRKEYRQVYASPEWPKMAAAGDVQLPWYHVYDDHEIANDWSNGSTTAPYPAAYDAFKLYNQAVNPPEHRYGETYFSFASGVASFFMMDTRRYRSYLHDEDTPEKTMLGKRQLNDLLTWLARPPQSGVRWKFVVSSVPFTKNWWVGGRLSGNDTWGGYMSERKVILDAMWDATKSGIGVVVLSGDRHEFAATKFTPPEGEGLDGGRKAVMEFSTSPLSMFWLPVKTYNTKDGDDECIAYIPRGNSKFGAIEMTDSIERPGESKLHYRLFIDGKEAWTYDLHSGRSESSVQRFWNWLAVSPNDTDTERSPRIELNSSSMPL